MSEEADDSNHDKHLTQLLQVTRQQNLKYNLDKLQFKTEQASFHGTTFTSDGHKPGYDKVHTIKKMLQATKVRDLISFYVYGQ